MRLRHSDFRLLAAALLLLGLAVPGASAFCGGSYANRFPVTNFNNYADPVFINDSAGIIFGGGYQHIACNATSNYFCYNGTSVFACYYGDAKIPTFIDEGPGSSYGQPDKDLTLWANMSGACSDASRYAHSCTATGTNSKTGGVVGYGMNLNSAYYNFGDLAQFDGLSAITVMAWVWLNVTDQHIVSKADDAASKGWELDREPDGCTFAAKIGASWRSSTKASCNYGEWVHVAGTYDGDALRVYVNGALGDSDAGYAAAITSAAGNNLYVGKVTWSATTLNGLIDDVRIYNRTLSASEISGIYNNTVGNVNYSYLGPVESALAPNITMALDSSPSVLYTDTDVNFSVNYIEATGKPANISVNLTLNGHNISVGPSFVTFYSVASGSTLFFWVGSGNYSKHDNLTVIVNVTSTGGETGSSNLTKEVQNSPPGAPVISFYPSSVIIGDSINASSTATDADGDALRFWYIWGWNNGTNLTSWTVGWNISVNATQENSTFRLWARADDREANGTSSYDDMNVTRIMITWPVSGATYYGKNFYFSFNLTTDHTQPCSETIDNTTYSLGAASGNQNHSRYVWYGNHTYKASCTSLVNSSNTYFKNVTLRTTYATWNISIYTENDWNAPLNISGANLSIIIKCVGGASYVYNFTGTVITGVEPLCDVETVSAKVDYSTDSYLRERIPPCSGACSVPMYMADALVYTILQIPIYMSDYNYYGALIELYKVSAGNSYTIAQGYFDVEHKYVTYLMKDNTYLIRITKGGVIRDIGYLYAATATAQYLSLSSISLKPSISLISDNLRMTAEMLTPGTPTSTLRIQYEDFINMTENVRIRVFQASNNTPLFDVTYNGSSNFSVSLNNMNTSFRYSVHFTVNHAVLGNSPIDFTVGVGVFGIKFDLGLDPAYAWLYTAFGFVLILFTSWIILPDNRLPGYLLLMAELGILTIVGWFSFQPATIMLFVAFLVSGIVFEIRHRGVT